MKLWRHGGVVLLGAMVTATVYAHDSGPGAWINRNHLRDPLSKHHCCNHRDCIEVERDGLQEMSGGYFISATSELWPYSRVLWESQDGKWWRCVYMADQTPVIKRGQTRCLIGPPMGM